MSDNFPRLDLEIKSHFQSVARAAALTGMVTAYARVLRRMEKSGLLTVYEPLYREIYTEMMTADEDFAAKTSKE